MYLYHKVVVFVFSLQISIPLSFRQICPDSRGNLWGDFGTSVRAGWVEVDLLLLWRKALESWAKWKPTICCNNNGALTTMWWGCCWRSTNNFSHFKRLSSPSVVRYVSLRADKIHSLNILLIVLLPWGWGQYIPPKLRFFLLEPDGVISQKTISLFQKFVECRRTPKTSSALPRKHYSICLRNATSQR
jgi:hypothetical protein